MMRRSEWRAQECFAGFGGASVSPAGGAFLFCPRITRITRIYGAGARGEDASGCSRIGALGKRPYKGVKDVLS